MVATAARTILDSLERLPNKDDRTQVGFITVDSSIHFYNMNPELSEPQMLVVSDLEDVFLPQPTHLLANLTKSKELIQGFLEKLPDMFKDTANVNNALGSALQAAFKIVVGQNEIPWVYGMSLSQWYWIVSFWWQDCMLAIDSS